MKEAESTKPGIAGWGRVAFRGHVLGLVGGWTLVIGASLTVDLIGESQGAVSSAKQALFASYQQVLFRHWMERHGGVCGPENIRDATTVCMDSGAREISTTSGRRLRLVNPAEVSRNVFGSLDGENTIHGHVTSLTPLDRRNAPDEWEAAALKFIARGSQEVSGVNRVDGRNYLRLIRPLITGAGCLQCHGAQGYRLGDIRGGVTVVLPLAPFEADARERKIPITLGHGGIWAAGMVGLLCMSVRLRKKIAILEQTRRALWESESRYRTLVEESPLGIYRTTLDGRIMFANQALLNMLGYSSRVEFEGMSLEDVVAPGSARAEFSGGIEPSGGVRGFRTSWRRRDGSFMEIRETATTIAQCNGALACQQGVVEDITDQARAAERLHQSEERFRNLVEGAPAGIFVVEDGRFQYLNPAALAIFGATSPDQLIGRPVLEQIHPGHRGAVAARIQAMVNKGLAAPALEEIYLRMDSTCVPVEVSAVPLSREKLDLAVVFFSDITQRKAAEAERERLSRLIELSHDAIVTGDANRVIRSWNRGAEEMYGWTEADAIGKELPSLVRTSFDPWLQIDTIAQRDDQWEGEIEHEHRDGERILVDSRQVLLRDATGRKVGILEINRDITQRRQAEDRLVEAVRQLEAGLAEKRVLLQEIHHRVKNNLAVTASLLSMKADGSGAEARLALQESQRRVHAIALVHEQLYCHDRLDRINFAEYARKLLEGLYYTFNIDHRRIVLDMDLDPIELSIKSAVPCALILNELLTNALKYAFNDGRSGRILVSFSQPEPGFCELAVEDDGVGLPTGVLGGQYGSLGFRIVGILSKQLNGSIEQRDSQGTCIVLRFPATNTRVAVASCHR